MSELTEMLYGLTAPVLQALARKLGVPGATQPKATLIAAFEDLILGNPGRIVDRLSEIEKKLAADLAYGDGWVDGDEFQARHGVPCPFPETPDYHASNASPLFLLMGSTFGPKHVPEAVRKALRGVLQKPERPKLAVSAGPPAVYDPPGNWRKLESRPVYTYESEPVVFAELRAVLKLVQAGKIKVTDKSGRPAEVAVRLIGEVLVVPDFSLELPAEQRTTWTTAAGGVRAHAWGVLVQQCGWAKARAGKLNLTPAGQKVLGSCEPADFAKGVNLSFGDEAFDELNRINHIRGQSGGGRRYLMSVGDRRETIVQSMEKWPLNRWLSFDEAARFVWASRKGIRVSEDPGTLYFGELQYGALYDKYKELGRQYLRAFLMESLATLGLIDIAYTYPHYLWPELGDSWGIDELGFCSRYDGLLYVRLNALGAYCLGIAKQYQAPVSETAGAFRVLANREVALVDHAKPSAADRHVLELFAAPKSDFVWELDPARILTHVESGGSLDDVTRFLESNSSGPIPETVRVMIADLARRASAVAGVEDAILIELTEEAAAALIAHDTQAAKFCHLAGKKRVAVPKKNIRAFRGAIKKLGFVIPNDRLPN